MEGSFHAMDEIYVYILDFSFICAIIDNICVWGQGLYTTLTKKSFFSFREAFKWCTNKGGCEIIKLQH